MGPPPFTGEFLYMSNLLVTVDDFKTYKNINNNDEDQKLQSIIIGANSLVKHFCGRTFVDYTSNTKIEFCDARLDTEVYLSEFPIIGDPVIEITVDSISYTTLIKDEDYFVNSELGIIYAASSVPFGAGILYNPNNFRATYTGGYVEVPEDLKMAIMDLVEFYRSEEYTPRKSFASNSIENLGFRETSGTSFPSHISRVMSLYRKIL